MNLDRRVAFAVGVSWASKAISIASALLLIPALFRYMSREELGLWYIIGNSQAYLGLFGFGLAPVLTRHIALLAKSSFLAQDASPLCPDEKAKLGDLLNTGQVLMRWMSAATMVVSWVVGFVLLRTLPRGHMSWHIMLIAWTLMCLGWSVQVWMSYLDCWLAGIGYVGWDTAIQMLVTLGQNVAYVVAVARFGGGLVALAVITLVFALVQRVLVIAFLRRKGVWHSHRGGAWSSAQARRLLKPSLQFWLTTLGAFLIYKTDQYFIAFFFGTAAVALYQSTYNTVMSLALGAGAATSSITVFASQLWAEENLPALRRLLVRGCRIGFLVLVSGELFLLFSGREFFGLWLGGAFLGYPILTVMLVALALDTQHGLLTNVSRATGDEAYAWMALGSGALNLLFTSILVRKLGVLGVPLGTLLAQLLTNNWYGVYRPLRVLALPLRSYVREVALPVVLFAAALSSALAFSKWAVRLGWSHASLPVCTACVLVAGLGFGLALVWMRMDERQKAAMLPDWREPAPSAIVKLDA